MPRSHSELETGCWVDGHLGRYVGEHVQGIARGFGWTGEFESADSEHYEEAWTQAEDYLNEVVAPEGTWFGSTEGGDWGLWKLDEDGDGGFSW